MIKHDPVEMSALAALYLLLAGSIGAQGAGPPAGADEVIRLAIKAHGKAVSHSGRPPLYFKIKKAFFVDGISTWTDVEVWFDLANKRMRETERVVETTVSGTRISARRFTRTRIVENGKERHHPPQKPGLAAALMQASYGKIVEHISEVKSLTSLGKSPHRYSVTIEREEKIGTTRAVTLKVKKKDMPDVFLSFDRATWLLVKSDVSLPNFLLGPVRTQAFYSDYKVFEGKQIARKIRQLNGTGNAFIGESKMESEYLEYRRLEKIDDSLFR